MIEVRGVSKKFGKLEVLKDVSISCKSGQCIALIGPNGCGKTTLMRCICGFTHPTTGQVKVLGNVIGKDADFTVIDLKKEGKINIENFKTKAQYSPFDGQEYTGEAVMTIINGKIVANKL